MNLHLFPFFVLIIVEMQSRNGGIISGTDDAVLVASLSILASFIQWLLVSNCIFPFYQIMLFCAAELDIMWQLLGIEISTSKIIIYRNSGHFSVMSLLSTMII